MTDPMARPGVKFHLDLDSGDVYQKDDNGIWHLEGTIPGTGGGFPGDGAVPAQVVGLVVDPATAQQADGTFVPALLASWTPNSEPDVLSYEVEWDDDPTFASPQRLSVGGTFAGLQPIIGGLTYNVRVRAVDVETLRGAWSVVEVEVAPQDDSAPAVLEDITLIPGYKMLGVRWSRPSEADFDHMEVRWTPDASGIPDPLAWVSISTASDSVILAGLDLLATYWVQVRAIDRSGNVATSLADPTAVLASESPEAGWCVAESETTTDIPVTDLAVHELAAEFVSTGVLDANRITTGTLSVGKSAGAAGSIHVYDGLGRLHGVWDDGGMVMVNPDALKQAMWLKSGFLRFTAAFTVDHGGPTTVDVNPDGSDWKLALDDTEWTTAVTPFGINVEAMTFGSVFSGSNLVPNAGCELAAFSTVADSSKQWTSAADWATGTTRINLDVATVDLKLTTV